jgi:hypothetical protein
MVSFRERSKLIYQLVFCRDAFIEASTQDSIKKEFERNVQFAQKYPGGVVSEDELSERRKSFKESTSLLRTSMWKGFRNCAFTFLIALIASLMLPTYPKFYGVASAFVLLWAVMGLIGWEIQTFDADTFPEQADDWWYRGLYYIGMGLLFIAIFKS